LEKHRFNSKEPEFNVIKAYISAGDCIIDIGANIGHYTKKFSDLVGNSGRVFAMEPVQATFALLSSNVQLFQFQNVTLLNCAVSKIVSTVGMKIPIAVTGLKNYQLASLDENEKELQVLTIPVDCLCIPNRVKLVKIDT
jgi:FkbM family methyltransferase